jgi:hypothetical protein
MGNPRSNFVDVLYTKMVHWRLYATNIDESFDVIENAR